jgi:hypothetical protein
VWLKVLFIFFFNWEIFLWFELRLYFLKKKMKKGNNLYPVNIKLQIHFSAFSFSRIYHWCSNQVLLPFSSYQVLLDCSQSSTWTIFFLILVHGLLDCSNQSLLVKTCQLFSIYFHVFYKNNKCFKQYWQFIY